jgi:ATP-dependent Clp protease ATP-binding subunit ClpC
MYQSFDKATENTVKLARTIAREYGLDYVGTEHVLLGICREPTGLGGRLLEQRDLSEHKIRSEIDRLIQKSMEDTWVFGRLPGSPHFRNVVARALDIARDMESKELRTEHLLLALLKEEGSVAYQALKALGCRYEDVEADVKQQDAS